LSRGAREDCTVGDEGCKARAREEASQSLLILDRNNMGLECGLVLTVPIERLPYQVGYVFSEDSIGPPAENIPTPLIRVRLRVRVRLRFRVRVRVRDRVRLRVRVRLRLRLRLRLRVRVRVRLRVRLRLRVRVRTSREVPR